MQLEEKIRFAMTSLEKMTSYTLPFICQILGTNDGQSSELIGSGIRCRSGDRQFIVSAWHVAPGRRTAFGHLAASVGNAAHPLSLSDLCHDQEADLSISLVSDSAADQSVVDFWPDDRIDRSLDRLSTDYLFVHGFPHVRSRSHILPVDSRIVSRSLPYGVMQRIDALPDDLDDFQFAMDFEPDHVESEFGKPESALFDDHPGPRGLSGSPVWRIGVSGSRAVDWTPARCQLVGIVTQWRPEEKLLVATKSTKLLELVRSIPAIPVLEGDR
jgi:hypothetical protein